MKRATHSTFTSKVFKAISIHALVKRATLFSDFFRGCVLFQSTPSWKGRPFENIVVLNRHRNGFQSTPSWKGRLSCVEVVPVKFFISIHALVKRATADFPQFALQRCISIHALVKRATPLKTAKASSCLDFNPRPREKGDLRENFSVLLLWYFNPRPREKGDQSNRILKTLQPRFQSTPSWKGRLAAYHHIGDFRCYFNPRPREKGDYHFSVIKCELVYFNPRPREKGDATDTVIDTETGISIHALVKRATVTRSIPSVRARISIHALVKRATANAVLKSSANADFNPRPREKGDY